MPVDPQQIRINELLLAREAQFVRVHDLEAQINSVLGGEPFPFTRPPLPSDRPRRKPGKSASKNTPVRAAATAGGTAGAPGLPGETQMTPPPQIRRLNPDAGEAAYEVTYEQFGKTVTEQHDLPEALRTLLASQGANLRVLRIDVLNARGEAAETLYRASANA